MRYLTDDDLRKLTPAESVSLATPVPTQIVSNGEFTPPPQTPDQRRVEAGIERYAEQLGPRHGLTRRQFLASNAGMAAAIYASIVGSMPRFRRPVWARPAKPLKQHYNFRAPGWHDP